MHRYASETCKDVDISKLIEEYNSANKGSPEFIIDASVFLETACRYIPWLYGGSMAEMELVITKFIEDFSNAGATLTFFLQNTVSKNKLRAWVLNEKKKYDKVNRLFSSLTKGDTKTQTSNYFREDATIPNNFRYVLQTTLKQLGIKLIQCKDDSSMEMSRYARMNKSFAILAQNTDFVVTNPAKYYMSLRQLDFGKLKTMSYSTQGLLKSINLDIKYLPLFAAVAGSDDVDAGMQLSRFHDKAGVIYNLKNHFKNLSAYVQQLPNEKGELHKTIQDIANNMFLDETKNILIEKCLSEFIIRKRTDVNKFSEEMKHWKALLDFCKSFSEENGEYYDLYTMMAEYQWLIGAQLEDFSLEASGKITSKLRPKLLGILLYEGPKKEQFQELIFTGRGSLTIAKIVDPIYPIEHPGIKKLWSGRDKNLNNTRWDIICRIFNFFSPDEIKEIPARLLVPLLSLRYVTKERCLLLEDWELNALLASAVCRGDYTSHDLKEIPFISVRIRAVNIYTIVTNVYNIVIKLLLAVGLKKIDEITPSWYQEGKLFHLKYNAAYTVPLYELVGFNDSHLHQLVEMKKIINAVN